MALLNNLEREELLGGLRSVPVRLLPALLTSALLYLSGDMAGMWALGSVALVPLCIACRGAGALGALLLATVSLLPAAVLQSFWLLDVEGVSPALIWLAGGTLPALAFFAIELPICRKIPRVLRPLVMVVLATAFWGLLPPDARALIPGGGMIESGLMKTIFAKLGLASMAGILTGLGWICAELLMSPRLREPKRSGWVGIVMALVLLVAGVADWVGSTITSTQSYQDVVRFHVVPNQRDIVRATDQALGEHDGRAIVVWGQIDVKDAAERVDWIARGGEVAQRQHVMLVMTLAGEKSTTAFLFVRRPSPSAEKTWANASSEMLSDPLVVDGNFELRVYPSLRSDSHWATPWSTEIYTTHLEPVHPAQQRFWIRELRREALIRGSRQICVWDGGGVAIDARGEVLAASEEGAPFTVQLPAADTPGQPLGYPRMLFVEKILVFSGPPLLGMLILLTPVAWAKRRYFAKRRAAMTFAIEEIPNEETNLTKEETEKITRSYKREDLE